MAGISIPVPGVFTGSGLPKLRQDEILAAGSLILIDGSHFYGGFGDGAPANGYDVQNVAWKEAVALAGGTEATQKLNLVRFNGDGQVVERSGKGGLHFIISQSGDLGTNVGCELELPAAIRAYLRLNPTHDYYMSTWHRLTRAANTVVSGFTYRPAIMTVMGVTSSTSNYLGYMDKDGNNPSAGARIGSRMEPGPNTVGNTFRSLGVDGWTGTVPSSESDYRNGLIIAGARGAYSALAGTNGPPSFVLYRAYLEDLTVSGRTYAEVEAIDYAMYSREVLTAGGKFYGDTFTAP